MSGFWLVMLLVLHVLELEWFSWLHRRRIMHRQTDKQTNS
jgi:hypothetical protein